MHIQKIDRFRSDLNLTPGNTFSPTHLETLKRRLKEFRQNHRPDYHKLTKLVTDGWGTGKPKAKATVRVKITVITAPRNQADASTPTDEVRTRQRACTRISRARAFHSKSSSNRSTRKASIKASSGDTGDPDPEPRRRTSRFRSRLSCIAAAWQLQRPDNPWATQSITATTDRAFAPASVSPIAVWSATA